MVIGIDYFSTLKIVNGTATYTGGTNYVHGIIESLKLVYEKKSLSIILFAPKEFDESMLREDNDAVCGEEWLEIQKAKRLDSFSFKNVDILFLPLVNGQTLKIIPKLKKINKSMKIYATLHDRQHNFYRFDCYDRYYQMGLKRIGVYDFFLYYSKRILFNVIYSYCCKFIDKLFTVSNFSMQTLMHKNIRCIKYYIQKDTSEKYKSKGYRGDYILMVGAGRPEKNLIRTLEAFCKYKKMYDDKIKFYITGVSTDLQELIKRCKKIEKNILEDSVVFFPYVSNEQLADLYANCRYVVFTSKGEGYGLPVREAMSFGKATLASRTTSIPEVAGSALLYVDPFNVSSIIQGFVELSDDTYLDQIEYYLQKRYPIIEQLSELDQEIFINDLLS